jgi:GNAT superfamily N-acetyltransferase
MRTEARSNKQLSSFKLWARGLRSLPVRWSVGSWRTLPSIELKCSTKIFKKGLKANQITTMRKAKKPNRASKSMHSLHLDSSKLVEAGLTHKRKSALGKGVNLRINDIAGELRITAASLWNYSNGHRVPPKETAEAMGDYFYGEGSESSRKFQSDMAKIRSDAGVPVRRTAALDRIDSGGELSVTVSRFPPFSGSEDSFLDKLIARVFNSGGLRATMEVPDDPKFDIRKALASDQTDLAVGYAATMERAVLTSFFSTPFRVCLGAVIRREDKDQKEKIQKALMSEREPGQHPPLHAIVIREDIGAIYVNTLNLPDIQVTQVDTMEQLIEAMINPGLPNLGIRVAVVNELISFRILDKLNGVPVMPLSSRKAAQGNVRHKLPAYFLGLGCSRRQPELCEMIQQLLVLFLSTEIESTANALRTLQEKLMLIATPAAQYYDEFAGQGEQRDAALQFRAAYNWTLYGLCLDKDYSFPSGAIPWMPILKRTREQILKNSLSNDMIEAQIKLTVGNDSDPLTKEQLHAVLESLDIELNLEGIQQEYVREDRDILIRVIQNALHGLPAGMPIESDESGRLKPGGTVRVINPKGDEKVLRIVDGFLAELATFYRAHVSDEELETLGIDIDQSPTSRLSDFRKNLKSFGEQEHCQVILAWIGKKSPLYIGGACLRPYKGSRSDLELAYLWTHPRYRDLGVGWQVIRGALEFAAREKFTSLVAEVFRTMNEQVTYFLKRGFEIAEKQTDSNGRLVLQHLPSQL